MCQNKIDDINVLGLFRLERKATILSLSAFLISIITACYGLFSIWKGPELLLHPPDFVVLFKHDNYLFVGSELIFSNIGDPGHNTIVVNANVRFQFGGEWFEQSWLSLAYFGDGDEKCREILHQDINIDTHNIGFPYGVDTGSDSSYKLDENSRIAYDEDTSIYNCPGDGKQLSVTRESVARAQSVAAGAAIANETLFAPRELRCEVGLDPKECGQLKLRNFLLWDTFEKGLKVGETLPFEFSIQDINGEKKEVTCEVDLLEQDLVELKNENWESLDCFAL